MVLYHFKRNILVFLKIIILVRLIRFDNKLICSVGKSTLADRFLEVAGAVTPSSENKQLLDKLQVERERGITVKVQYLFTRYYLLLYNKILFFREKNELFFSE